MPSGAQIQLANSEYAPEDIGYAVNSSSKGSVYNESSQDRAYMLHFDAVGAPYAKHASLFNNSDVTASECALWMCIQSYDTSMVAGKLYQNVTMEFSLLKRTKEEVPPVWNNVTFADIPAAMRPSPDIEYNVSGLALTGFTNTLSRLFNGTAELNQADSNVQNDVVEAIWDASSDLDPWIKKVVQSINNAIRYDNVDRHQVDYGALYPTPCRSIYDGKAFKLDIRVQWYWLILPVACVALSNFFLVMVIIKTAKSPVVPWKSNLLAALFFDVDQELKQRVSGPLSDGNGVIDAAGNHKAVLREEPEAKWAFKTA